MRMDLDFTGRHVFVFGGTTGINFGIAQAFARCGAHVSVASRKRENVDAALARLARRWPRWARIGGTALVAAFSSLMPAVFSLARRRGFFSRPRKSAACTRSAWR